MNRRPRTPDQRPATSSRSTAVHSKRSTSKATSDAGGASGYPLVLIPSGTWSQVGRRDATLDRRDHPRSEREFSGQATCTGCRIVAQNWYPPVLKGTASGWTWPRPSVARAMRARSPGRFGVQSNAQRCHACSRLAPRGRARCQLRPPSVETSTRAIGAYPDQERPVTVVRLPAGSVAPGASSKALLTGCTPSGFEFDGYCGPTMRYWAVFQNDCCGVRDTSIEPTHLMLATPTQP